MWSELCPGRKRSRGPYPERSRRTPRALQRCRRHSHHRCVRWAIRWALWCICYRMRVCTVDPWESQACEPAGGPSHSPFHCTDSTAIAWCCIWDLRKLARGSVSLLSSRARRIWQSLSVVGGEMCAGIPSHPIWCFGGQLAHARKLAPLRRHHVRGEGKTATPTCDVAEGSRNTILDTAVELGLTIALRCRRCGIW